MYTNTIGLTYIDFQLRYFSIWYKKHFIPQIGNTVGALTQYIEIFNSRRDRYFIKLSRENQKNFKQLKEKYFSFGLAMSFYKFPRYSSRFSLNIPANIETLKTELAALGDEFVFTSCSFRELLDEIRYKVFEVTSMFNDVFGKNIFDDKG